MALRVMALAEMRLEVLLEAGRGGETVTAVGQRHGTRETFYFNPRRFQAQGIEGLEPRSRPPVNQPSGCRRRSRSRRAPSERSIRSGALGARAELLRKGVKAPAVSAIHGALVGNNLKA
jgi:hypothetical protein